MVRKSWILTVSTEATDELKYSTFRSQRFMGFLPVWTPASIGHLVAASTSLYLAHDDVRFSSTGTNAGNAYASHRRHVLKKKQYHFRPLPRAGWSTDSSALPLPGAAHGFTAGRHYSRNVGRLVTNALCARDGGVLFRLPLARACYSNFGGHLFRLRQFRRFGTANRQATRDNGCSVHMSQPNGW